MAKPVTVKKIDQAIREIETEIEDAALDGEYHKADSLSEKLDDLQERKKFGEIYLIDI